MKERKQISKWLHRIIDILFYSCLVIVIFFVLQVFAVASFKIPSDSMQPSLLPGDCILVDKCSGGARLFNVFDAVDRKELNIHRVSGWRNYKRNDVLVFNFPYHKQRWDSIAFDVMLYYVKRCIAIPGDTLEIRDGYYKIRGITERLGDLAMQQKMSMLPDSGMLGMVMETYPWNEKLRWSVKNFGPLPVPVKGNVVKMDSLSWLLYRQLIGWEQKCRLRLDANGHVYLGDSLIREYKFKENYYFMAGDNAFSSQDSRYWGLLPEAFVVGRAWRVWKSVNPTTKEARWERVLKRIDGLAL